MSQAFDQIDSSSPHLVDLSASDSPSWEAMKELKNQVNDQLIRLQHKLYL